jgi:ATP-dependent helicase HrpA
MDVDLDSLGLDGFPDELHHAGETYTLYYNATRGERDEGVTIGVHIDQLPAMPAWLPEWGVDGDLQERVELLIRGLPKDFRRACQPVASLAQGFAEAWCGLPKDGPLHAALTQWILDSRSVPVPSEFFGHVALPAALVTKLWVCDDDGGELAFGVSVEALRERLSIAMKQRFESAANAEIGRTGMSVWDGEPLPESIQTPGGPAYPALVDEGGEVGIQTFQSQTLAAHQHCIGMARLLIKANETELRHVRKRFPISLKTSVALNDCFGGRIGMDDLLLAVAKQLLKGELFRSPVDFRRRSDATRGHWYEAATRLGHVLDGLVDEHERIRDWLARHRGERHLDPVMESIQEQLAWLFRDRFLQDCKAVEFSNLGRYMAGIRSRIKRLESLPLARDLEKLERFDPLWNPWYEAWRKAPKHPELWPHGYDLEEYRISLFAPDVPVQGKISEKRLATSWAGLVFG